MQIIRKDLAKRGPHASLRQAPWYILHPKYSTKYDKNRQGAITGPSASQSLRQKFLTSPFNIMTKNEDRCMQDFCAALIQATYKMSLTRRLFKYHRFAMYHIGSIQIQWAWRNCIQQRRKKTQKSKETVAAEKI